MMFFKSVTPRYTKWLTYPDLLGGVTVVTFPTLIDVTRAHITPYMGGSVTSVTAGLHRRLARRVREAFHLDHLRDARALLEEALGKVDLAVAQAPDDDVSGIKAGVVDALSRIVERIDGWDGSAPQGGGSA